MIECPTANLWLRSAALLRKRATIVLSVFCLAFSGFAAAASQRATIDRSGVLTTRDGLTLKLIADEGSIRVVTLEPGASPVVRYSVHVETDLRGKQAQEILDHYSVTAKTTLSGVELVGALPPAPPHGAQFSVHFEIAVPANYSLDISTEVGDIETLNIGGTANLVTQGGNIRTKSIGRQGIQRVALGRPVAKLVTEGGHIHVEDVLGDISAFTAGGHIVVDGKIHGEANLHTGGGHIIAKEIWGRAELATEGGNISVGKAAKFVSVKTGGGQIDFGEVDGSVHAQTGGGGIRVINVAGPMEVESNQGSICLTSVASSIRAATGDGTITAWISPKEMASGEAHLAGASQLSSGSGDIIVYLPRNLAANIEAIVENGGEKQIEADPALALSFSSSGSGMVKGWSSMNGGGAPLRLKTTAGRIKLQFLDSETGLRDTLIREQRQRLEDATNHEGRIQPLNPDPPIAPQAQPQSRVDYTWTRRFELQMLGGIREDSDVFQTYLTYAPRPAYPLSARKGGVEGRVRLQVRLTQDGKVQVEKVVEGSEPTLVDAAIAGVKQWRGKAVWMNGKQVDVISTVTVDFKLRSK
ncbi:MAG TPA: energy transducer TonB [Candidatus Eremiobacteraceae bacterium]|nr:energy transducer TonB [Candidatus Eremiobacteraceae bacterium]